MDEGRIIRKALLCRLVEERLLTLFSQGKLHGTVHTSIGQELCAAVLSELLIPGDTLFSNHRCHGHYLALSGDVRGLIAEVLGKATGVCRGIGGSQHLCRDGFFSNGIQGGIAPVAAGLAMSHKLQREGTISVVFIGDGTLGEGVLYETLNLISKWSLPLVIVLEDNGIAQSTPREETLAGGIVERFSAFGIKCWVGNTWEWKRLYESAREAVDFSRQSAAPALLLVETYRLKAHSKGDDTRPREEVEAYEERDPLNHLLKTKEIQQLALELKLEVDDAVAWAEAAHALPNVGLAPQVERELQWTAATLAPVKGVKSLNDGLHALMERDQKVIVIGEDVRSPYGGAFKVTQGLSDRFSERVRNAPISEAAIVGLGSGLGLRGYRPIVEVMFGDFLGLAFDQIVNHAAKFEQMYAGKVELNVIIRSPMGGRRGYGPTHSQTLDKHFVGVPGLRVVALSHFVEPARIYEFLCGTHCGPTLVIENKTLYATPLWQGKGTGFTLLHSQEELPTALLAPHSEQVDLTLVGYGGMTPLLANAVQRLFDEHDLIAQVISPTQIYPLDLRPLFPILSNSEALVVVEEGVGFSGFGAEVLAQISPAAIFSPERIDRLSAVAHCIPASPRLEQTILPGEDAIIERCLKVSARPASGERRAFVRHR